MTPRMVINGKEVPKDHMMMERIDRLTDSIREMPKAHPDRKARESELGKVLQDLMVHRRKEWVNSP